MNSLSVLLDQINEEVNCTPLSHNSHAINSLIDLHRIEIALGDTTPPETNNLFQMMDRKGAVLQVKRNDIIQLCGTIGPLVDNDSKTINVSGLRKVPPVICVDQLHLNKRRDSKKSVCLSACHPVIDGFVVEDVNGTQRLPISVTKLSSTRTFSE